MMSLRTFENLFCCCNSFTLLTHAKTILLCNSFTLLTYAKTVLFCNSFTLLTYAKTSVLVEKLTLTWLGKKFRAFYGINKFISLFTRAQASDTSYLNATHAHITCLASHLLLILML